MPGCGPISKAVFAAKTILLLLGSTHGGNLDERVEFREYVYEGLRNVRWEHSSKLVGAYYVFTLSLRKSNGFEIL